CVGNCPGPPGASGCNWCAGNDPASCYCDDGCPGATGTSQCSCPLSGAAEGGALGRYSFDAYARSEADCEENGSATTFGSNTRKATRRVPWLRFPIVRFRLSGFDTEEATLGAREQDDEFCRILRAAIERGQESCPIGVSREPGTKKPIMNYQRPDRYH